MIQNLIIINNGIPIFNENFGECYKFDSDPMLLSAFFDALHNFSMEFNQGILEQMKFKKSYINYLKIDNLLIIAISDKTDGVKNIELKLMKISNLFTKRYSNELKNHPIEISQFKEFRDILLGLNIIVKNCGEHSDCSLCSNREATSSTFNQIVKSAKVG